MKPRKRAQQTQSARLFLRNHDHREAIFNQVYSNSLYASKIPKDPDKPDKDLQTGIFWKKYPKMQVIQDYRYSSLGSYGTDWGCIDAERQFSYTYNAGINPGRMFQLKDYAVKSENDGYSPNTLYVSKDGFEWQHTSIPVRNSPDGPYGENGIISVSGGTDQYLYWDITKIEEDEDGKISSTYNSYSLNLGLTPYSAKYICNTHDGALIYVNTKYRDGHVMIYELVDYNATLMYSFDYTGGEFSKSGINGCRKGSFYAFVTSFYNNGQVIDKVYYSNDKYSWTAYELRRYNVDNVNDFSSIHICERDNWFYIYSVKDYSDTGVLRAWKSDTGVYWVELNLPYYIDLPVLNGRSGGGISQFPFTSNTVRISLDPSHTPSSQESGIYTVPISRFFEYASGGRSRLNRDFGNLMFSDGKLDRNITFLGLYDSREGQSYSRLYAFIDNMTFTKIDTDPIESKSFAWCSDRGHAEGDFIIEGDYVGGLGQLDPNENYGEDMYVWDDENSKYLILDQATLNWDEFPGYQLLRFDKLPETGQTGIIYIVPRKYKPSYIKQYIWNPYESKFELLENASYDLSNYTFTAKEVPYLPSTGEVGIIYLIPKDNVEPPEEETFIAWIEYIWSADNNIFMTPEELGIDFTEYMMYEYVYLVSLPQTGVANTLYLVPENAPQPEPEEEET